MFGLLWRAYLRTGREDYRHAVETFYGGVAQRMAERLEVSKTWLSRFLDLAKALGAPARTIRLAFLTEAAMLSTVGALVGYLLGQLGAFALRQFFPVFPAYPPEWAVIASLATALVTGLLFGVMPARRAARLDPANALMKH